MEEVAGGGEIIWFKLVLLYINPGMRDRTGILFFNIVQKYIINKTTKPNKPKPETLKGSENLTRHGDVNRPNSQTDLPNLWLVHRRLVDASAEQPLP